MQPKPEGPFIVHRISDICQFFQIGRDKAKRWLDAGCPTINWDENKNSPRIAYDLAAVAAWSQNQSTAGQSDELKLRKQQLEVNIKEVDYQTKLGKLVDRETAKATVTEILTMVKTRLEAMPGELSKLIPTDFAEDFIQSARNKISMVLTEMSEMRGG